LDKPLANVRLNIVPFLFGLPLLVVNAVAKLRGKEGRDFWGLKKG